MAELVDLPLPDCRRLLQQGSVGRLAFVTARGLRIVPLNYATNRDAVVFRTLPDSELGTYGAGAEAVFEIDEVDPVSQTGWSVVAHGRLARLTEADEVWDVHGWRNPTPWATDGRYFHLKLEWQTLTGRRLA